MRILLFDNGGGLIKWEKAEQPLYEAVVTWIAANCTDNGFVGIASRGAVGVWNDKWGQGKQIRHFRLLPRDAGKLRVRWAEYVEEPDKLDWTSQYQPRKKTPLEKALSWLGLR